MGLTLVDDIFGVTKQVDSNFVLVSSQHQPEESTIEYNVDRFVSKQEEHQGQEHKCLKNSQYFTF
jgi:hypothetical protein